MARYQAEKPCAVCHGARLKPEALAVKVAEKNIAEASELSIRAALDWFSAVLPTLTPQRAGDRAAHPARDRRAAAIPGRCRARLPDAGPRLGHALGRREPAHPAREPDRLGPDRRALRARRAVDRPASARQRAAAGDAAAAEVARQHGAGRRARRGRDPRRRPRDRHGAGGRRRGRARRGAGHAGGDHRQHAFAHRRLSRRAAADRGAAAAPPDAAAAHAARGRRHRQQPQEPDGGVSARHVHLRHRRLRRRQVDAGGRYALQGGEPAADGLRRGAGAACPHRRAGTARQDHRHRPVADRPHAAQQPRDLHRPVRADPRLVRRAAGKPRARLQVRPVQLQRQGRALRGMPGRRRAEDRDAFPARRVRHLRHLQGPPLQPRDAGGEVPRQVDRRGAGDDGGRGGAVFLRRLAHP